MTEPDAPLSRRQEADDRDEATPGRPPWWHERAAALAERVVWRLARDAAWRAYQEERPVTVGASLQGARAVLVLAPGGLADVVATRGAIAALRRLRREARVDLLTTPRAASLLARDTLVDQALEECPLPPLWRRGQFREVAGKVAARSYDLVLFFGPRPDRGCSLLAHLSRARLRISCGRQGAPPFFNVQVVPEVEDRYLPERNLCLLGSLGVDISGISGRWIVSPREADVAERLLQVKGLKGSRPLVAFDPGPDIFGRREEPSVARSLAESIQRRVGARGILLSEVDQRELPSGLGMGAGEARELGLGSLREAVAVLSRCDAFVGGNTSFFHFAVSLGMPAVGLLPRETPVWWRPGNRPQTLLLPAEEDPGEQARRAAEHIVASLESSPAGGRV